jgi:hypothetical protein
VSTCAPYFKFFCEIALSRKATQYGKSGTWIATAVIVGSRLPASICRRRLFMSCDYFEILKKFFQEKVVETTKQI